MSSKKYLALDQGCIRSVCCSAVWPLARALAAGCQVDEICPRCWQPGDTIFHRCWECSSCEDSRK
eukprot:8518535-Pyramimonas_sp.AAC.1